jgi:hypothetical protein
MFAPQHRFLLAGLLCAGLISSACTVGESVRGNAGADDDADDDAGDDDDGGGADARADAAGCDQPVTAGLDTGHHNPGLTCIASGCHDGGTAGAPAWTIAGTVFDALGGTAAVPGATIHLIDGAGADVALVTAQNGNFYSEQAFTFPLTAKASRCPDVIAMVAQVQTADAGCNKAGCHVSGMRIYLPPP